MTTKRQAQAAKIAEKAMTTDEVRAFLAQETTSSPTGLRNKALLTLMVTTGLRVSEALGIRPRDLETDDGEVVAARLPDTKAGVPQKVEVNEEARHLLHRWMERRKALGIGARSPVFCTVTTGAATGFADDGGRVKPGGPLSRQYVHKLVRTLAKRAGIEGKRISPHSLRHTFGTEVARTQPQAVVQAALRHTTPDMSSHYVHIAQADVRKAVGALPRFTDEGPDEKPEPDTEALELAAKIAAMTPEAREALRGLLG